MSIEIMSIEIEVLFAIGEPFKNGVKIRENINMGFIYDEELLKRELYRIAEKTAKTLVRKFKEQAECL